MPFGMNTVYRIRLSESVHGFIIHVIWKIVKLFQKYRDRTKKFSMKYF